MTGHVVVLNGKSVVVEQDHLSGFELRVLFDVPPEWALVKEESSGADFVIGEDQVISLGPAPANFYTRPPTAFGANS